MPKERRLLSTLVKISPLTDVYARCPVRAATMKMIADIRTV